MTDISSLSPQKRFLLLVSLLSLSLISLYFFFTTRPSPGPECNGIGVSTIIEGALPKLLGGSGDLVGTTKHLWSCAESYRRDNPGTVLATYMSLYIGLQAFAIPGPIILSILAGALYNTWQAQGLILLCATAGSIISYGLSSLVGRELLQRLAPTMLSSFGKKVEENRSNLFYYMLFLRLTPFLPNWFINVACPIVGVPLHIFTAGTAIGLLPANYFHVNTGKTLTQLTSLSFADNKWPLITLFCLQFVVLLPTLCRQKIAAKAQRFVQ